MKPGHAYWLHTGDAGRVFIPVVVGPVRTAGLVIDADGLHKLSVPITRNINGRRVTISRVLFEEKLTARQVRGRVRKMPPATKGARKLKHRLIEGCTS